MGNVYGYVRVSTKDQNEDRQHIALQETSIPDKNIFVDKQSGKDFKRPMHKRMLRKIKNGQTEYKDDYGRRKSSLPGRGIFHRLQSGQGL